MNCKTCGAPLRPGDLYCGRCGAKQREEAPPAAGREQEEKILAQDSWKDDRYLGELNVPSDQQRGDRQREEKRKGDRRRNKEKPLYDERLYRDSFLDRSEDGQHALLVTLVAILIAVVCIILAVMGYFYYRRNMLPSGHTAASSGNAAAPSGQTADIVILSDGQETAPPSPAAPEGGAAPVTIETEKPAPVTIETEKPAPAAAETEKPAPVTIETEKPAPAASETEEPSSVPDQSRMETILTSRSDASSYAVFVYDLKTNESAEAGNAQEPMYASATITVPVLYTAAVLLDQGTVTLNDPIIYRNSIGGRGLANPETREGKSYPLSDYLATMLHYSDNNCMNCLIDFFTLDVINSTCRSAGYGSVDLQRKIVADVTDGTENYVSARDLAMMTKELYNGKFRHIGRDFMRQYFYIDESDASRTILGLSDAIPSGTMVLDQNGRGDTRYSEVAVISDENCSYIISLMMMGDYGFAYEEAAAAVSGYVYECLAGQLKDEPITIIR